MRTIPGIRARLHITATFERNLPLYSRILRHVGRWLGMVNKLSMVRRVRVGEQKGTVVAFSFLLEVAL